MKPPANYTGVLLLDDRDPKKYPTKLSTEQKSLLKAVSHLLESLVPHSSTPSNSTSSSISKHLPSDAQRLLATLIIAFQLNDSSARSVHKLYRYFKYWEFSISGQLIASKAIRRLRYSTMPSAAITPIGMDNWKKVMCYMDSLLFSMFYTTSSFDFLLDSTADENLAPSLQQEIEELKTLLRFVVNLLRSGEYIRVGIIEQVCIALNSLGCDLALSCSQQDALQLYEFLAESLSLPLLTMKLDIIHSGKLNLSDDLRLIQERTVLISVPTDVSTQMDDAGSSSANSKNNASEVPRTTLTTVNEAQNGTKAAQTSNETKQSAENTNGKKNKLDKNDKPQAKLTPVSLEECLNNYFNNSVTVKRHLDKKRERKYVHDTTPIDADELSQYEKMGIVHQTNDNEDEKSSASIDSKLSDSAVEMKDSPSPDTKTLSPNPSLRYSEQPSIDSNVLAVSPSRNDGMSTLTDFSSVVSGNSTALMSTAGESDYSDPYLARGSISKVSERIEASRTRSSTIVSVLNNVHIPKKSHLTRRSSSISNVEVNLPAWMFLQLLPYYTDPSKNLKFENHEMLYRSRNKRSRTIDSLDSAGRSDLSDTQPGSNKEVNSSAFEQRFADRRPIVPICLKRYVWDSKGRSHKNSRKVIIPEIMKMPYFIAEDRKRPGFVDFRRNFDNTAPRGSFMLVLDSCVCHRGSSVNSGHYISLARKRPFDPYVDKVNSDTKDWIIFNDMMHPGHKIRDVSFNEAMDSEDPYILFYRVVELHDEDGKPLKEYLYRDEDAKSIEEVDPLSSGVEEGADRDHYLSVATQFSKANTLTKYPSTLESEDRTLRSREQSTISINPTNSSLKLPENSSARLSTESDLSKAEKVGKPTEGVVLKPKENETPINGGGSDNSVESANSSLSSSRPVIKIDNAPQSTNASNLQPNVASANSQKITPGIRLGRLGIGKSKSKSGSKEHLQFSAMDDISPSESFYIGVQDMYYWYKIDSTGEYSDNSFDEPPGVRALTDDMISDVVSKEEEMDGGFMDKLNTRLLSLRKSSGTPPSLVNFSRHHHHHHHHHHHNKGLKKYDEQHESNDEQAKLNDTEEYNESEDAGENDSDRYYREAEQHRESDSSTKVKISHTDTIAPKSRIPELDSYSISSKDSKIMDGSKSSQGSVSIYSSEDHSSIDPLCTNVANDDETAVKKYSVSEPVSRILSPAISETTSAGNRVLSLDASRINSRESEISAGLSSLAQKGTAHDLSTVTSAKTTKTLSIKKHKSHKKSKLRGIFKKLLPWEGKKSA